MNSFTLSRTDFMLEFPPSTSYNIAPISHPRVPHPSLIRNTTFGTPPSHLNLGLLYQRVPHSFSIRCTTNGSRQSQRNLAVQRHTLHQRVPHSLLNCNTAYSFLIRSTTYGSTHQSEPNLALIPFDTPLVRGLEFSARMCGANAPRTDQPSRIT